MMRSSRLSLKLSGGIFISLILMLVLQSCQSHGEEEKAGGQLAPRPNILLIIADDAGWNDMSFHGSEIETPNIDKLAKNGMQLSRFYVSPTCSPSRASLLTGMPASRMGIVAPISGRSEKTLPDSIETLPQALQKAGYETALMGKWHLGLKQESGPKAYGFDYSYGFLHGQIDQYAHTYKNGDSSWYRNGKFITEKGHATDLITKEAIDWLSKKRDTTRNFYLQVAYSAPHIPLQEPEEWKEKYREIIKDSSRRDYAAAMSHLDFAIGELMKSLSQQGLENNTLIVFISDNGAQENWYPTTQYEGKYGPNAHLGSNFPFRDFKKSNYEGAIRVPAIVYWKDHLVSQNDSSYVTIKDLMPTFLEAANYQDIPSSVEGKSIWPLLKGQKDSLDHQIYIRGHLQESIIEKPWKLVRTRHLHESTEFELYNVEKDPSEKKNLISEKPEVVARLKQDLQQQFAKDADTVNVGLR